MTKSDRFRRFLDIDIYPVTCEKLSNGRKDEEILERVIEGGAKIVQLRDKDASRQALSQKARHFREVTAKANVLLIINDHIDIAMDVEADGVHLGQDDFSIEEAVRMSPDLIIGASTHSLEQARRAKAQGATYINVGPVFATQTKEGAPVPVGVDLVKTVADNVDTPLTVMGGIKSDNIHQVLEAGARRVAVVTAITQAPDPAEATTRLRELIIKGRI